MSEKFDPISNFDSLPDSLLLNPRTARAMLPISESTFWRLVRDGHIKTHKLTERTTAIKVGDLREFMKNGTGYGAMLKAALKAKAV